MLSSRPLLNACRNGAFRYSQARSSIQLFSTLGHNATPSTRKKLIHAETKPKSKEEGDGINEVLFDAEHVVQLIIKDVHDAVAHMEAQNEDMTTEFNATEPSLHIHTNHGKFSLSFQREDQTLRFMSYISGIHFYFFALEEEGGLWLSVRDGHDFRGLFTRDILKHNKGCPVFK